MATISIIFIILSFVGGYALGHLHGHRRWTRWLKSDACKDAEAALKGADTETVKVTAENVDMRAGDLKMDVNASGFGEISIDGQPVTRVFDTTIRSRVGQITTATIQRYCIGDK